MAFIERVGKKKVGFYFGDLFIITYFRFYEVSDCKVFNFEKILIMYNKKTFTDCWNDCGLFLEDYRNFIIWITINYKIDVPINSL
jgi:hypothetical protein